MTFIEYKKKIGDFLVMNVGYSETTKERALKIFEKELQECWEDGWDIKTAATGIQLGF